MLRILHRHKPRKMSKADLDVARGPFGRISKLRKIVTGVVRHERIEATTEHADEARGYVERVSKGKMRIKSNFVMLINNIINLFYFVSWELGRVSPT